jgi:hypothetical protein
MRTLWLLAALATSLWVGTASADGVVSGSLSCIGEQAKATWGGSVGNGDCGPITSSGRNCDDYATQLQPTLEALGCLTYLSTGTSGGSSAQFFCRNRNDKRLLDVIEAVCTPVFP